MKAFHCISMEIQLKRSTNIFCFYWERVETGSFQELWLHLVIGCVKFVVCSVHLDKRRNEYVPQTHSNMKTLQLLV